MRIAEVIGRVVLSRCDPKLVGGRFMVLRPYDLAALAGRRAASGEIVVAYEQLGADLGMKVGVSEGREAAMPFHPDPVALDAYVGCLLDEIHVAEPAAPKAEKLKGPPAQ